MTSTPDDDRLAKARRDAAALLFAINVLRGPAWAQSSAVTRLYPGHGSLADAVAPVAMRAVQMIAETLPYNDSTPVSRSQVIGALQSRLDYLNHCFGEHLLDDDADWNPDPELDDAYRRLTEGEGSAP